MNRGRPMQNLRYTFFLFWAFCTLVRLTFMFSSTCWTYLERTRRPDRSASFATSWRLFTWHTLPRRIPPEVCCFKTWKCRLFKQPRKMMISETGNVCWFTIRPWLIDWRWNEKQIKMKLKWVYQILHLMRYFRASQQMIGMFSEIISSSHNLTRTFQVGLSVDSGTRYALFSLALIFFWTDT